jgi:hypothetical protein
MSKKGQFASRSFLPSSNQRNEAMKRKFHLSITAAAVAGALALIGCDQATTTESTEGSGSPAADGASAADTEMVSLKVSGMT